MVRCSSVGRCASNGTDYLIMVGHELYNSPYVDMLANQRASYNGYNVSIVDVENMDGYPADTLGIRDFIKALYDSRTAEHMSDGYLGFVVLVGDAYKDDNNSYLIPDYDAYNHGSNPDEECADNWYACLTFLPNGRPDDYPDVMVGRLTVGNETELGRVVSKIIDYETVYASGPWRDDVLLFEGQGFCAGSQFASIDAYLRARGQTTHFLYYCVPPHASNADHLVRYDDVHPPPDNAIDDATQKLISQLNDGRFVFNYECDHGSTFGFHPNGEGRCYTYFDVNDIPNLTNGNALAFWLNVCCYTGQFDNTQPDACFGPNVDCLAEQLLYAENRGAVAVLASSRQDYTSSYGVVDKYVYEALFDGGESLVGGAVLEAKLRWSSKLRHKYNLFGDPSLSLYPQGLSSTSQEATAYNGGRRLLTNADNLLHLAFESHGKIFYTYGITGDAWVEGIRLSSGNGQNKYPSITGTAAKQFVVWQRYTGYTGGRHRYDIYMARNTGNGWLTGRIDNLSGLGFSVPTDPLPVVTYKTRAAGTRLLVCARTSSGIKYVTNDYNGAPTKWSSPNTVPGTNSLHANPSLSMGPSTPAQTVYIAYDDGNNVYCNAYYDSGWGSPENISSGCGAQNNRYPSVEVDEWGGRNVAWQGYSVPLELNVVIHRRNNEASQMFAYGGEGGNRPSITGLAGNKRAIVCTSAGYTDIYRSYFNGSGWTHTLVANNGRHPSLSAGTTQARYVWTSSTSSPYQIKISGETLSKGTELADVTYHRASVLQDSTCRSLLWVELGEIALQTSRGEIQVMQRRLQGGDLQLTAESVFHYLDSEPFLVPEDADSLVWRRTVYVRNVQPLV